MTLILFLARAFVGGVFIYSGWEKLMAPIENFKAIIEGYQFLPSTLVTPVAFFVPCFELIFGTFLVLGFLNRTSAVVLGLFLITFITLLSRSLWLRLPISECGCFGSGITLPPWQALILDSGLLILALILIKKRPSIFSLDKRLHQ